MVHQEQEPALADPAQLVAPDLALAVQEQVVLELELAVLEQVVLELVLVVRDQELVVAPAQVVQLVELVLVQAQELVQVLVQQRLRDNRTRITFHKKACLRLSRLFYGLNRYFPVHVKE